MIPAVRRQGVRCCLAKSGSSTRRQIVWKVSRARVRRFASSVARRYSLITIDDDNVGVYTGGTFNCAALATGTVRPTGHDRHDSAPARNSVVALARSRNARRLSTPNCISAEQVQTKRAWDQLYILVGLMIVQSSCMQESTQPCAASTT